MMQGDSCGLLIDIVKEEDGSVVTPSDILDVEITIGFLKKRYTTGEVTYNEEFGKWVFPLSQEESFSFPSSRLLWQVRVKYKNGSVRGSQRGYVLIDESVSKEVL